MSDIMKQCYYILDDMSNVIAIFQNEEFARDYLDHMLMEEDNCHIGVLADNVFRFEEHDAKYFTLKDSSLKQKRHQHCKRFTFFNLKDISDDKGYCLLRDDIVNGLDQACGMIEEQK